MVGIASGGLLNMVGSAFGGLLNMFGTVSGGLLNMFDATSGFKRIFRLPKPISSDSLLSC